MVKDDDIIPADLVEDEDIFEVLQELVKDADVLPLCPKCKIAMALEEYESANCTQCGSIEHKEIIYVYRDNNPANFN